MQFKTFDIIPHDTKFDFVSKRRIAVTLSILANLAVIITCIPAVRGLNFGVDFAGGTEMEVQFNRKIDPADIRKVVEDLGFKDAVVQTYGDEKDNSYLIRVGRIALTTAEDVKRIALAVKAKLPAKGEPAFDAEVGDKVDFLFDGEKEADNACALCAQVKEAVEAAGMKVREVRQEAGLSAGTKTLAVFPQGIQDKVEKALLTRFPDARPKGADGKDAEVLRRVEYVGPAVGKELRNQGFRAILYAMALIVIYVGLRFDFRFSPGVIVALIHDAVITLGYFAFSGREFNLTSVAVILTVVGYSVNDTVVVYDRIRENTSKFKGRKLTDMVNASINEVLGRTTLTSFATALSLIGLLIYGVGTIFDFAGAMMIGIISGTYSTWFIAAPLTIWLEEITGKKNGSAKPAGKPEAKAAAG